jgi:integrating conjugative element protein (TIGR03761 family)
MALQEEAGAKIQDNKISRLLLPTGQPGGLRNATTMTIQTRQAKKFIEGRQRTAGREPIVGLMEFGHLLRKIWLSAELDDPYADWFLVQIEQELQQAKQFIGEKTQWLNAIMLDMKGFNIQVAESSKPLEVALYFQNPYGYIGAYIVHDYDALVQTVYTARHIGLLDRAGADNLMQEAGKAIRSAFNKAAAWRFTGVARGDLLVNTPNAQRAFDEYGECPAAVVLKEQRARFAPVIKLRPEASKPAVAVLDEDEVVDEVPMVPAFA